MSPNGISSGFDEIFSTDSSDSEFLSQLDVKSRGNQINKQWEAIERTLYQEPGQQVTDPELLRECKLWRESFPHFRVKGTRIEVKAQETQVEESEKNAQTLENHFSVKALEEKRESIKKKVVGVLVERLMAKFGAAKRESAKSRGVHITQVDEETAESLSGSSHGGPRQIKNRCRPPTPPGRAKESYFERGKAPNREISGPAEGVTVQQVEKKLSDVFDSWRKSEKAANPARGNSLPRASLKSSAQRFKHRKFVPPLDSLSSVAKPFEMTNRIDRKYDGLIERIMDRQRNGLVPKRQCRSSSCQESHHGASGGLRAASGLGAPSGGRTLPRLNKLSNPWLDRSAVGACRGSAGDQVFGRGTLESSAGCGSQGGDERFLGGLNCRRPRKGGGVVGEVNVRRARALAWRPEMTAGCWGSKKGVKGGAEEGGVGSSASSGGSKGSKMNGGKNFLPPFETGIICTELTGRPKIGPKNPSKRY